MGLLVCLLETHPCSFWTGGGGKGLLKDSRSNSERPMFARLTAGRRERVKMSPSGNSGSSSTAAALILLSCQRDLKRMHEYTEPERRGKKKKKKPRQVSR